MISSKTKTRVAAGAMLFMALLLNISIAREAIDLARPTTPDRASEATIPSARYYVGHVGTAGAVLCIAGEQDAGRYFLRRDGIDVQFAVKKLENGRWIFRENDLTRWNMPTLSGAEWNVLVTQDSISGNMQATKESESIPVRFVFKQEKPGDDYFLRDRLFCEASSNGVLNQVHSKDYYFVERLIRPVRRTKSFATGNIVVSKIYEPVSKVSGVRITAHPKPTVKRDLNFKLNSALIENVNNALDALSEEKWDQRPDLRKQDVAIFLPNRHVLSIKQSELIHHPISPITRYFVSGFNYDLKTGRSITPKDLFTKEYFGVGTDRFAYLEEERPGYHSAFIDAISEYLKRDGKETLVGCFAAAQQTRNQLWLDNGGIWFSSYYVNDDSDECKPPIFLPYRVLRGGLTRYARNLLGRNVLRSEMRAQEKLPSAPYPIVSEREAPKPDGGFFPFSTGGY